MERLLDRGVRGFTLSDKPEMLGLPELPHAYFEPMWDLFDESGAVANFHIGAGARREEIERLRGARYVAQEDRGGAREEIPPVADTYWHSFGLQRQLAVQATQMPMSNVRVITNLCASNLFDRFPNLKVVSAESGIGWVPFALEALEFQLDEMVTEPDEAAYQQRRPTEYFRDHIYVMFWFEQHAPAHMIEKVGVNNVLVETDVPHPTCLYPGAREHFSKVMGGLDEHIRRRVLQDNAVELYRLDPETATA
jgi:predicted TIM-barrel fold metal-dependent hydrolase